MKLKNQHKKHNRITILQFSLLLSLFFFIPETLIGQSFAQKDSLISVMCETLMNSEDIQDELRIQSTFDRHLHPFLSNFQEDQIEELGLNIFFRFQRDCKEFRDILDKLNPPQGDWKLSTDKPIGTLKNSQCKDFFEIDRFYYKEENGDTVNVKIENGFWIDSFKDGTYSKLILNDSGKCEFEIEFMESDNFVRRNYSRPGDKYIYQILDRQEGFYNMSVEVDGKDIFQLFKLYFD